jgi:hypothetical protein
VVTQDPSVTGIGHYGDCVDSTTQCAHVSHHSLVQKTHLILIIIFLLNLCHLFTIFLTLRKLVSLHPSPKRSGHPPTARNGCLQPQKSAQPVTIWEEKTVLISVSSRISYLHTRHLVLIRFWPGHKMAGKLKESPSCLWPIPPSSVNPSRRGSREWGELIPHSLVHCPRLANGCTSMAVICVCSSCYCIVWCPFVV